MKASISSYQKNLDRLPVRMLDLEAQMLAKTVMSERLLGFLETHLSDVCEELFEQGEDLGSMRFSYSMVCPEACLRCFEVTL